MGEANTYFIRQVVVAKNRQQQHNNRMASTIARCKLMIGEPAKMRSGTLSAQSLDE